jgi:spore protease
MDQIRTDLALEMRERIEQNNVELKGVRLREERIHGSLSVSTMVIETENGAKSMGKPRGTYVTIEAMRLDSGDEDYHREISLYLARILEKMLRQKKEDISILVVGLGNRNVAPDSLGPMVVDNLFVTRHIVNEFGKYAFGNEKIGSVSTIVPGVMAQTGMESLEIIRGIAKETKPDVIVAVDALAARSTKRLGRTIQITDTGIIPGSGVGNHRNGLNEKTLGVPVISIGVPTVIDANTIVTDTVKSMSGEHGRDMSYQNLGTMFVTPKDIDETVKRISETISEGLNIAFHRCLRR